MSSAGRRIRGIRKDLRGIRQPEVVRRLIVDGPGVGSLAGVERLRHIEQVTLERPGSLDLSPLRSTRGTLTLLAIDGPKGELDYTPLADLSRLETLILLNLPEKHAEAVATLDVSRLQRLADIQMNTSEPAAVSLRLGGFPPPRLRTVNLLGFQLRDADLAAIVDRAPNLERLAFAPASGSQRMLARGIPGFIDHTDDQVAPLEHIFEHGDGSAGSYFSVGIDVAARWSLETNLEGEIALRDLLHRTIPEVAARLTYDTESAAVWVLDPRRTDLEQVLRLIVQQ